MVTMTALSVVRWRTIVLGIFCGIGACRVGFATDIASPAVINSTDSPLVLLNQTGGTPYQWQMVGNQTSYTVGDQTAGTAPFVIEAAAPHDALRVDSTGRIGLSEFSPQARLHVTSTDAIASLRLQSIDNTAPGSWELGSNFGEFNIVDAFNMGNVPFRIAQGAPTDTFSIDSNGRIGLGITTPTAWLHGRAPASAGAEILARFDVDDDALGMIEFINGSATNGIFHPKIRGRTASQAVPLTVEGLISSDVGSNPVVAYDAARIAGGAVVNRPLVVYRNNLTVKARIAANGDMFATSFNPTSSRSMKDNIVDLDSQAASAALRQLTPVEYVYKDDASGEKRVGFIAEDVPEIVANADRQSVPIMDVLALVTRVVKDQQQVIEDQKKAIDQQQQSNDQQKKRIDDLMTRLSQLESRTPESRPAEQK